MSKCGSCKRGPLGAEGHLDLYVSRMGGGILQFNCRTCGTLWVRSASDSSFRWQETREGIEAPNLPGRNG